MVYVKYSIKVGAGAAVVVTGDLVVVVGVAFAGVDVENGTVVPPTTCAVH
jgi:hypothetical protein